MFGLNPLETKPESLWVLFKPPAKPSIKPSLNDTRKSFEFRLNPIQREIKRKFETLLKFDLKVNLNHL